MFKVRVKENQKALIYKEEKFVNLLDTGVHKLFNLFGKYRVELVDTKFNGIEDKKAKILYKNFTDTINKNFQIVDLKEFERAFIKIDGKFTELLPLGTTKLYFKELNLEVEKVDIRSNYELTQEQMEYIDTLSIKPASVKKISIAQGEEAYLFKDEQYIKRLESGVYYYFSELNKITIVPVDKRLKEFAINQQELLTKDKVTVRVNVVLHYKIVDGLKFVTEVDDANEYIYKQLQFAVREHISSYDIDEVLQNQHTISSEIVAKLKAILESIGVEFNSVHIKDIILPGDMREIFNQVIEAQKRAEANNIKRREETAATRSLLNTAKLMKDNPTLARLKELEALEKITQTVGTLNVYGGLDSVMGDLVKLK